MPCWSRRKEIRSREFFPLKKLEKEVRLVFTWDQCSEDKRECPLVMKLNLRRGLAWLNSTKGVSAFLSQKIPVQSFGYLPDCCVDVVGVCSKKQKQVTQRASSPSLWTLTSYLKLQDMP